MGTVIRPEVSTKNKYWISKHRHYELKHFCLQYRDWKKAYNNCSESAIFASCGVERMPSGNTHSDLTAKYATKCAYYSEQIRLIERAAMEADIFLYQFILKAVTEGLSYTYLKTKLGMPCGKDMYYNRYRKFFWILSELKY